ncbi:MAG: hypothetical protein R2856_38795 [Caldilineaceae bacterium]
MQPALRHAQRHRFTADDSNPAIADGQHPAGGAVTIARVAVSPDLQCPSELVNTAKLLFGRRGHTDRPTVTTLIESSPQPTEGGDFGDA